MEATSNFPAQLLIGTIALLDSLPDLARAALAALLLLVFIRFFEVRIPANDVQYGQSFRKAALLALLIIPLVVWLFPSSRMIVFVEELPPRNGADHWLWLWLLPIAAWCVGALTCLARLVGATVRNRRELATLVEIQDEKLALRLAHWQRRLGMDEPKILVQFPDGRPRQLRDPRRIGMPGAARHWPGSTQDVLLIQALCHSKLHHIRWHTIAQIVACCYWPITWVQSLHGNLLADFQRAADGLAESCYQDRLGYQSALRQLESRLARTPATPEPQRAPSGTSRLTHWQATFWCYVHRVLTLLNPAAEPPWQFEALLAQRNRDAPLLWTEPYDKVVLFIGQAVFLAFLLTGITLREKPPEVDYEYSMPFELLWKEHFHRNLELLDRMQRAD